MSDLVYDVFPIDLSPARAEIISGIMRKIAATENVFADYTGTCEAGCVEREVLLEEMCPTCLARMGIIAATLTAPTSRVWEVWKTNGEDPEVAGVISFTDIQGGIDAKAHYIFFDQRLSDKTPIMRDIIAWAFEDHEGWRALARLTIEIPKPFGALARHASRKLGFGGGFRYKMREVAKGTSTEPEYLNVEGVKRDAVTWKGRAHDLLILGLRREDATRTSEAPPRTGEAPTPEEAHSAA